MVLVYRGDERLGRMRVPEARMTARLRGCRGRGGARSVGDGASSRGGSQIWWLGA
jgi:hypothetical protein